MQKLNFKWKLISMPLIMVLCFGLIFMLSGFSESAYAETAETKIEETAVDSSNFETVVNCLWNELC